jgi:hypothetical protein
MKFRGACLPAQAIAASSFAPPPGRGTESRFSEELAAYEMSPVRIVKAANLAATDFGYSPVATVSVPRALPGLPSPELRQLFLRQETPDQQESFTGGTIHRR